VSLFLGVTNRLHCDRNYRSTLSDNVQQGLRVIGAVTAELKDCLYRILDPQTNSIGYVAKSGYHVGTPVTLSLSEPTDLHELVSFLVTDMLVKLMLI